MSTFRYLQRDKRHPYRKLGNTSYGGPGYLFCERHRSRYPDSQSCPVCLPGQKPIPRRRRYRG